MERPPPWTLGCHPNTGVGIICAKHREETTEKLKLAAPVNLERQPWGQRSSQGAYPTMHCGAASMRITMFAAGLRVRRLFLPFVDAPQLRTRATGHT